MGHDFSGRAKRSPKKILISAVAIVLALGIGFKVFGPKKEKELDLPVAEKEFLPSFTDTISCIGHPKPDGERYVSVQKGGRMDSLNVKVGDQVTAGSILGVVDRTLNASNLKSALSSFRLAQKEYNRMAGLSRTGSASREEFDKAQANIEVKRADLERAKQGVEDSMLRAPADGRVAVVIFRVGDKVPDGSRILAIETPGAIRLSCRVPSPVTARLPETAEVSWLNMEQQDAKPVVARSSIFAPQAGGFVGLDREILLSSEAPTVSGFERHRIQVTIPLKVDMDVSKVPSDAVIKRTGGFFVLTKTAGSYQWLRVEVLRRDGDLAFVQGIGKDQDVVRIKTDLNQVEMMLARMTEKKNKG